MTPNDINELRISLKCVGTDNYDDDDIQHDNQLLLRVIAEAVAQERERCAKVILVHKVLGTLTLEPGCTYTVTDSEVSRIA